MTWAGVNARSLGLGIYGEKIGDYRTRFKNLLSRLSPDSIKSAASTNLLRISDSL